MKWIDVRDRLPPYGEMVFMVIHENGGEPCRTTGYRKSTDAKGEHWVGPYDFSRDTCEIMAPVIYWLDGIPEVPGGISGTP